MPSTLPHNAAPGTAAPGTAAPGIANPATAIPGTATPGQRLDACLTPYLAEQQRLGVQLQSQQDQLLALTRAIEQTRLEIENLEVEMSGAVRAAAQADPGLRRILGLTVQDVTAALSRTWTETHAAATAEPPSAADTSAPARPPHGVSGAHRVNARVAPKVPNPQAAGDLELDLDADFQAPEDVLVANAGTDDADTGTDTGADDQAPDTPEGDAVQTVSPAMINADEQDQAEKQSVPAPAPAATPTPAEEAAGDPEATNTAEADALACALADALVDQQIAEASETQPAHPTKAADPEQSDPDHRVDPNDPLASLDVTDPDLAGPDSDSKDPDGPDLDSKDPDCTDPADLNRNTPGTSDAPPSSQAA